jgi:hypothetical protein
LVPIGRSDAAEGGNRLMILLLGGGRRRPPEGSVMATDDVRPVVEPHRNREERGTLGLLQAVNQSRMY